MTTDENPPATQPGADSGATALDPTKVTSKGELIGELLNGRYVIQHELKRGGMGVVYLAKDQQLHSRPVVVKLLLDDAYQSEYVVQKFHQEVEALSRIDHPGIVGIIDAGELRDGKPFIVMQYVEGVTLRSAMSPEGMSLERTGDLFRQIGRALSAAHSRGIFHRDLKPDNIMLQDLGRGEEQVKIIDFGIAKVKDSVIAPSTSLNLSPGTVAYMAPEQLNGRTITSATDIFALGAIAYEVVTGRKPFNPETGFELLQMQQAGVRVKPSDLRPSLPLEAQEVILKALSFNPSDRYSDPREFGDQLARALAQEVKETSLSPHPAVQLPPTQLSSEETPLAKAAAGSPAQTINVPFQAAPPITSGANVGVAKSSRSKTWLGPLLAVIGLGILCYAGYVIWYVVHAPIATRVMDGGKTSSGVERTLNYGLTVQKMRSGQPYQDVFESSGQEIFENGWKFRMNVTSPQEGYLYLLNEGPTADGATTYNVLFPEAKTNGGSARVRADQRLQTSWMRFDEHQGTEKFWIVWSASPVKDLEAVKTAVNEQDQGEIKDPAQGRAVRDFLNKHSSPKPDVIKDSAKKQTIIKGKGDVLASFIELEHH
ncbi:MAG: Serine/threonine protein kinase [Acidobacteria bacterium]|nr:Serine/threonine protein kinase [Acidobacteriota bacterium]